MTNSFMNLIEDWNGSYFGWFSLLPRVIAKTQIVIAKTQILIAKTLLKIAKTL